ncbi:hypothetical protein [Gordonia humi]|uniref:DUF2029 domain-containing protein n=1 Tax=Gordonia humi TaxID=686429 RepID=A0A840EY57_9ACTN|nr:hypothetical protein [Gordonia humi]MBB4134716.1 hypothetical protein [Gordonia humi]
MTPPLRWNPAATAVAAYLAVRLVGVCVLAVFAIVHHVPLDALLTRWDGKWMLDIARYGYDGVPTSGTDAQGVHTDTTAYAFFPGYPLLVGALAALPLISPFGAGIVLNVVFGAVGAVGVARLGSLCARQMRPDASEATARNTGLMLVVLFAATPMSVVLSMTYTEAMFCALAAWALVGVLEHRWILAGLSACAVGLVRPTGIAVIVVVMLAAALTRHNGSRAWIGGVLAPLGYVAYMCVVWARTGSPSGWFHIQTQGWDTSFDGGKAVGEFVFTSLTDSSDAVSVLASLVIIAAVVLLVWSAIDRVPWPVLAYAALVYASVLLSSGLMPSRPRLLLPAFVVLLPVAIRLARSSRPAAISAAVAVALASAWFGAFMLTVFDFAI